MTRALPSVWVLAGVLVVLAFNVLAFVFFTGVDGSAQPAAFTAWFLGDAAVGLIALGLTDRRVGSGRRGVRPRSIVPGAHSTERVVPYCLVDPPVTPADIDAARERIAGRIRRTPVMELEPGAFGVPGRIVLKLELLQHTGSFKVRGAFNRMLAAEVPEAGVIAASGGNFGLAVAYAARELGHRAEVFVPETSPPLKARRIEEQGAHVRLVPGYYDDALTASRTRAEETGAMVMHAFDQPEVVAGQGTIGAELSEDVPDADTVLVAVGGGGLIGGIAAWFVGRTRVVGVEPDRCPTMSEALRVGRPVPVEVGGYAADSLGSKQAGEIAFAIASRYVEHVLLVTDDAFLEAQRRLWEEARLVAEPGGAAALAALLSGRYRADPDERVVVLVCGANTPARSFEAMPAER